MSDDLQRDVSRAKQAELLLADELLLECFSSLESDYLKAWKETGARETDARERLWQAFQIVGKVKSHLQSVAASGKLAQRELDQLARPEKRRGIMD